MVDLPGPIVFAVILLAIPLQMMLSPKHSSELDFHLSEFAYGYYGRLIRRLFLGRSDDDLDYPPEPDQAFDDDEAIQDEREENEGYYGLSTDIRDIRPPWIKFRVGDVVKHRKHNYKGVVIGWDEEPFAPEEWIIRIYGKDSLNKPEPCYAVVIDTRQRLIPQISYVRESSLIRDSGKVLHPVIDRYFERYNPNTETYPMRPWLAGIYPND